MVELRTTIKEPNPDALLLEFLAVLRAINPDLKLASQTVREIVLVSIRFENAEEAELFREGLLKKGLPLILWAERVV